MTEDDKLEEDIELRNYSSILEDLWDDLSSIYTNLSVRKKREHFLLFDDKSTEDYKVLSTFYTEDDIFIQVYDTKEAENLAELVENFFYKEDLIFDLKDETSKKVKYSYQLNFPKIEERDFRIEELLTRIELWNNGYLG